MAIQSPITYADFFDQESILREDGWMVSKTNLLLFWVPPWHRVGFWKPQNMVVIGSEQTKVDLSHFVVGKDWYRCKTDVGLSGQGNKAYNATQTQ